MTLGEKRLVPGCALSLFLNESWGGGRGGGVKVGFKNIFSNGLTKKTRLETAIKWNSKMAYEVGYLGLPLSSFVLKYED